MSSGSGNGNSNDSMTNQQEAHLSSLIEETAARMDDKYRKGAAEHGGNLWDLSIEKLVDNAIEEAVDQLTYLLAVRHKLRALSSRDRQPTDTATAESGYGHGV